MKHYRYLLHTVLAFILLSGCESFFCAYSEEITFVEDRSFEDQQIEVNQILALDLDDYWHFENCTKHRVERGFETVTVRDSTIAHFLCAVDDTIVCTIGTWQDYYGDNAFTLKAVKPGSTDVEIELYWEDTSSNTEEFSFKLTVVE